MTISQGPKPQQMAIKGRPQLPGTVVKNHAAAMIMGGSGKQRGKSLGRSSVEGVTQKRPFLPKGAKFGGQSSSVSFGKMLQLLLLGLGRRQSLVAAQWELQLRGDALLLRGRRLEVSSRRLAVITAPSAAALGAAEVGMQYGGSLWQLQALRFVRGQLENVGEVLSPVPTRIFSVLQQQEQVAISALRSRRVEAGEEASNLAAQVRRSLLHRPLRG